MWFWFGWTHTSVGSELHQPPQFVWGLHQVVGHARLGLSQDENVIHLAQDTLKASQEFTHLSLKVLWRTRNAEWELVKTVMSHWCDKGCEKSWGLRQGDLPKSTVGIQLWKDLELSQCLIHLREWMNFSEHTLVERLQVDTDVYTSGLRNNYHSSTPRGRLRHLGNHSCLLHPF